MADVSGPVFDGRAAAAMHAYASALEQPVADVGVNMVRANLGGVLRHPTGRYQGNIQTDRSSHTRVTDGNIIYGNWLEGAGSRNRTTRFKGYFTFRRTTAQLQAVAAPIAETALPPYLARCQ